MNKIIVIIFLITLLSCKTKNQFEEGFLSAIEVTANNNKRKPVDFNVGYTIEFKKTENQDCLVESKEELNSIIIEPTIRSIIRNYVRALNDGEIELIDRVELKNAINEQLTASDISINSTKLVNCPFEITMFAITRRK